jgi:hypothetical protein
MSRLTDVLAAEKAAEGTRKQAEAEWRRAWWETSFTLAEPETKDETTAAYDLAEKVLGHGRDWLTRRRRTGKAFAVLENRELVEPRKAVEVCNAGVEVTPEVIAMLKKSEAEGESMREFSARLRGRSWSAGSPEVIASSIRQNPETAKAAAEALAEMEAGKEAEVERLREVHRSMRRREGNEENAHVSFLRGIAGHGEMMSALKTAESAAKTWADWVRGGGLNISLVDVDESKHAEYIEESEAIVAQIDRIAAQARDVTNIVRAGGTKSLDTVLDDILHRD